MSVSDRPAGSSPSEQVRAFNETYDGGPPPWDIGRPQPAFVELADHGLLVGRVLDVGCGTGEHALLAAAQGADATGIDAVPKAISPRGERLKIAVSQRDSSLRTPFG